MQPAIQAGRALLALQKLLADNGERHVTAMRGSAVLEQKNSLPGAELSANPLRRKCAELERVSHNLAPDFGQYTGELKG